MTARTAINPALWGLIVLLALLSPIDSIHAQTLTLKRTLTQGAAPGCPPATPIPLTRRDNAEARRLSAAGQEAALIGDRAAARDAFAKAAALNPTDERIAYDLARAHEELADAPSAVREYCRYLSLAPAGPQASDVRTRLSRMAPRDAVQASERALDRFRVGVSNYDRSRFDAAWQAFDDVVRASPHSTEALYNRAVARIALGRRDEAARDLQAYLAADPAAIDRLAVTQAIEALRRPSFNSGEAFRLGLLPGFGQFYTRRPALGVLVIAGVAGATVAALYERTDVRLVDYVDPNGVPVPYEEEFTERPYLVPAIATAAVVTLGAAFEAYRYARGTQRAVQIEPARGVRTGLSFNNAPVDITPHIGARGQVGLGLFARF